MEPARAVVEVEAIVGRVNVNLPDLAVDHVHLNQVVIGLRPHPRSSLVQPPRPLNNPRLRRPLGLAS